MRIRRDKRIWYVGLGVFAMMFVFAFLVQKYNDREADAANLAAFDPGYIISDYQMGNYNSMNEAQIQSFLKSKNSCNDTNLSKYTYGPKVGYFSEGSSYSWHVSGGHFVCMADESFNGESAAHIIYRAAQDYRINPQVLIVTLQKEQGLVTDTFPNSVQYRSAMGFGCPDTAACSSKYYGFKNQVRNAAALYREVLDGGWTNYPVGNNYVKYNPNAACGGSVINIRNRATSSLYRYTPYQPNASSLAAGYGQGDSCGANGNKNFYLYFEDWFGGITFTKEADSIGRTIEDGTYQLISAADLGKVVNVEGSVGANSGKLNIGDRDTNNMSGQLFKIEYDNKNGYYTIKEGNSNLALDVSGSSLRDSAQVILWTQHDGCNQDWVIRPDGGGYYTIISRCSNKVLDATVSNNVVMYSSHGGNNQKWALAKIAESKGKTVDDGVYQFMSAVNYNKAIALDKNDGLNTNSEKITVQSRDIVNMDGQLLEVKYNKDGYYSIIDPANGLALDVSGAKVKNSTSVGMWSQHDGCNQDWVIEGGGNGSYVIYSRCSSKALDATAANKVIIYDSHGGDNQKWIFGKVANSEGEVVEDGIYQIASKVNQDKVIDIKGGAWTGMSSGKTIIYNKNAANNDSNQLFKIEYNKRSGYYNITNPLTGLALDVGGANVKNSTAVGVWSQHDGCNQDWLLQPDGDGYYTIMSRCSSKPLDVTIANKVIIYDGHGGDNQKWQLVKRN